MTSSGKSLKSQPMLAEAVPNRAEKLARELKPVLERARKNTEDDWKFVDTRMAKLAAEPEILTWVYSKFTGLRNKNRHVRDVAASILESRTDMLREPELLVKLMQFDPNIYVRYRLAFAHAKRGIRTELVMKLIKTAATDKDVGEIAKKHLASQLMPA